MEGQSSSEVFFTETQTWNVSGKQVLVSITGEPDGSIKFLGVAGQRSAGDICCMVKHSAPDQENPNTASLQISTGNGIVDVGVFEEMVRDWIRRQGYTVVN